MNSGIYKILNKITGKFYIGSSYDLKRREREHFNYLRNNKHKNKYLQSSWNLHGEEAFEFIVLEYCEISQLMEKEQLYLDALQPYNKHVGYNSRKNAELKIGIVHSNESKLKMAAVKLGYIHSKETKAKMSAARIGRIHTQDTIDKMRAAKAYPDLHANRIGTTYNKLNRKWPHPGSNKCKCRECLDKKNLHKVITRKSRART